MIMVNFIWPIFLRYILHPKFQYSSCFHSQATASKTKIYQINFISSVSDYAKKEAASVNKGANVLYLYIYVCFMFAQAMPNVPEPLVLRGRVYNCSLHQRKLQNDLELFLQIWVLTTNFL